MLVHFWCKFAIYAEFCATKGRQPIQILMVKNAIVFNLILFLTMKEHNIFTHTGQIRWYLVNIVILVQFYPIYM